MVHTVFCLDHFWLMHIKQRFIMVHEHIMCFVKHNIKYFHILVLEWLELVTTYPTLKTQFYRDIWLVYTSTISKLLINLQISQLCILEWIWEISFCSSPNDRSLSSPSVLQNSSMSVCQYFIKSASSQNCWIQTFEKLCTVSYAFCFSHTFSF